MRAYEPEWKRTTQWFPRFTFHLGFQQVRVHFVSWQEGKNMLERWKKELFLLASPAQFWEHSKTTRQPWSHGCSARGEQGGKKSRKNGGKGSQKKRQLFSKHFDISNICHSFSLQSLLMFIKVLLEGRVLGWNLRFTSWQMRIFVSNL